jgi:hypothetical protein
VEQPAIAEPVTPVMEEPPVTRPTSPSGGAHDEGDPGDEGLWSAMVTSADPIELGAGAAWDALSSAVRDPPTVAEQAIVLVVSTAEVRLGSCLSTAAAEEGTFAGGCCGS